jgi:alkanesulfonate monooxygenase SsuD/methylene tetrahydromethanopterin reductase-like flavin-dependent oxidoreductase (luciferase family)
MRFGIYLSNIGSHSDPATVADLAAEAEGAGWEALFVWDHLAFVWGMPSADPWVVLSACAVRTSTMLLGTGVTPIPRRRVQNVAHAVATLDRLSGGRVVFGAGLGGNRGEFERFGDDYSRARRIELLDEGLARLRGWLDGEEVDGVSLEPPPERHIPIWIGGNSDDALARAARYDGWLPDTTTPDAMKLSPEEIAEKSKGLEGEIAVAGYSDRADPREYAEAGATWWLESFHDMRGGLDEQLAVIRAGPPTIAP